ncbi:BatD family protein [Palleronia rufa]|uniref:BatD family protein n=1 Tax=Palleronia rufa TaxID=1530186 RepID=UPI00055D1E60|nr:BatD family protein [Palleronia rufa]
MRVLLLALLLLAPTLAAAQTRDVKPGELTLSVRLEYPDRPVIEGALVLLTVHGTYRRHITLESLTQPGLDGFNWFQLGEDQWYETTERGKRVKNFKRRIALYPNASGPVTIGPFVHELTLTDESDDWFAHAVASAPLTLDVDPASAGEDWWFPVRDLKISDSWSNPPDQLAPGEGVLRVIRLEAVGASPDMIPEMPELTSPSAMIYPHPEARLVELSPEGPVTIAFWRWTIQPTNAVSAIVEPIDLRYFDTATGQFHDVVISAQRIAYDAAEPAPDAPAAAQGPARLSGLPTALAALVAMAAGLYALWPATGLSLAAARRRIPRLDPLERGIVRALRDRDARGLRRALAARAKADGLAPPPGLARLDRHLFAARPDPVDLDLAARERSVAPDI